MSKTVEFVPANNLDTLSDPYFKEEYGKYKIKSYNAHLYHIAMEKREFKTIGGLPKKISHSQVVKMTEEDYRAATLKTSMTFAGYVTHILHLPASKVGKVVSIPNNDAAKQDDDNEITLEGVNAMTSLKDAKDLYRAVTDKDPGKNWSLDKTKVEIIKFLGIGEADDSGAGDADQGDGAGAGEGPKE